MKLTYAKNCDIYYDTDKEQIVFAKRGKYFVLKKPREDVALIKKILCDFEDSTDVDGILGNRQEQEKKTYLSYVHFLWKNNILIEDKFKDHVLRNDLKEYLIANFNANEDLVRFWEETTILCKENEQILQVLGQYGLKVQTYQDTTQVNANTLVIGNVSKEETKRILKQGGKVLLYREKEETSYLLMMSLYDEKKYIRFQNFVWEENSFFYAKNIMIAFNIVAHVSEHLAQEKKADLLVIAGDGTIHRFDLSRLQEEGSGYFNRNTIPEVSEVDFVIEAEQLADQIPYVIESCNKNNEGECQSPICNYEVNFGEDFNYESFVAYHEEYRKAAAKAFVSGFEKVLNQNGHHNYRCGLSLEDYYIKGYISLLQGNKKAYPIVNIEEHVVRRIAYLQQYIKDEVKAYFVPFEVESVGKVILCDSQDHILQISDAGYQINEMLLELIYQELGQRQNGRKILDTTKLQEQYEVLKMQWENKKELDPAQIQEELKNYFANNNKLIDEKIWSYQVQIIRTGMHIGEFYFVN